MCLAKPGQVIEITAYTQAGAPSSGRVQFGSIKQQISLFLVPEVVVGDWVTVHTTCAIGLLSEADALATIATLNELAEKNGDPT